MIYSNLQRDRRYGTDQMIMVKNRGLEWDLDMFPNGVIPQNPTWLKVHVRGFDSRNWEIGIQGCWTSTYGIQVFWGSSLVHLKSSGQQYHTIGLAWKDILEMGPENVPGTYRWPVPDPDDIVASIDVKILERPAIGVTYNYYLEWWYDMLIDVPSLLKNELDTCGFSQTIAAGFEAPDDVLVLTTDDDHANEQALTARYDNAMVVISNPEMVTPDPDFAGGFGREGRELQCKITVFSRSLKALDPDKEYGLIYASYLAEDIKAELSPPSGANTTLGDYLYYSRLEMALPPTPVPDLGDTVATTFTFTAFKMTYQEDAEVPAAGTGIEFNFNTPWIEAAVGIKQNDHSLFYVTETSTWHLIGIRCLAAETGTEYFSHYSSPDLRTWTELAELEIGSGLEDWMKIVFAPEIRYNPNYGVSGAPLETYKFLMFFTGVTAQGGIDQEQKIGLYATNSTDLTGWVIQNSGEPIYWPGMDDTGNGGAYAAGAPWCPATTYDGGWGGACRDQFIWQDGDDWYMGVCCKKLGDTSGQQLGLAKFPGGDEPDFLAPIHEANPLIIPEHTGTTWYAEGSGLAQIGTYWYLTCLTSTYRIHPGADAAIGQPWDTGLSPGVTINSNGFGSGSACELVYNPTTGKHVISGHIYVGSRYVYKFNEVDFSEITGAGQTPIDTTLNGIAGLIGLNGGAPSSSLTWSIEDHEGYNSAFYYQPVWGDAADQGGFDPSGMTGNAYIDTYFTCSYPGSNDGQHWSDYSQVGYIKSSTFALTRDRITLMIGGAENIDGEFVALVRADNDRVLFRATGADSHTLREVLWDTTTLMGDGGRGISVYLVAVDQATADGSFLALDAIREYTKTGADSVTPITPLGNGPVITDLITI
jgi:hypothetical protein